MSHTGATEWARWQGDTLAWGMQRTAAERRPYLLFLARAVVVFATTATFTSIEGLGRGAVFAVIEFKFRAVGREDVTDATFVAVNGVGEFIFTFALAGEVGNHCAPERAGGGTE